MKTIAFFLALTLTIVVAPSREATAAGQRCAVTVVDGLAPGRSVVVVGCNGSGIAVLDTDLQLLFRWDACSACGGFFGAFAETKVIKGRKVLMVQMTNGSRMEDGSSDAPKIALHFDGQQFRFADHFGE